MQNGQMVKLLKGQIGTADMVGGWVMMCGMLRWVGGW